MTPDVALKDVLGSASQIIIHIAIALFAIAFVVVAWLCCTEHNSPDK